MKTNFPKQDDDLEISLHNSSHAQFDYEFALQVKKDCPEVFAMGKTKNAFKMWTLSRDGDKNDNTLSWVKRREAYISKNSGRSDVPGLVALMKYGGVAECGDVRMKEIIRDEVNKVKNADKSIEGKGGKEMKKNTNKTEVSRRQLLEKSIRDAISTGGEMPTIQKLFATEIKKFEDGSYRFIASEEIRDSDDEIVSVEGGDFERYAKNPVWIWGHRMSFGDVSDVIGKTTDWRIEITENGNKALTFSPVYAQHQTAQDLKQMHEDGIATAISIGFRIKEYDFDNMVITSWELLEVSNVIVPANENAIAYASGKSMISKGEEKHLIDTRLLKSYKSKMKAVRDLYLSDELCTKIGYTKTGNETLDFKSVFDILTQSFEQVPNATHEDNKKQPTAEFSMTAKDVANVFGELYVKYGINPK